jgi:hypothetical protein
MNSKTPALCRSFCLLKPMLRLNKRTIREVTLSLLKVERGDLMRLSRRSRGFSIASLSELRRASSQIGLNCYELRLRTTKN